MQRSETPPPTSDRRRFKRFPAVNRRVSFLSPGSAEVLNLSFSGLALRTSGRLEVGKTYPIRLSGAPDAGELTGTIRWCQLRRTHTVQPGEVEPIYEAGVCFDRLLTKRQLGLRADFTPADDPAASSISFAG